MTEGEHFVVVDDEEDLLRPLAAALRRARPAAEVMAFSDSTLADAHLAQAARVDALITDIRMPKLDGIELLVRARHRRPRLPAVIMTAFPSPVVVSQVSTFGTVEYLDKPFSVATFTGTIDRLLQAQPAGFDGALAIDGLPDLIQLCALSNATSALRVTRGGSRGTIWFERGLVVHARCGAVVGLQAFYEIVGWKDGTFAVERGARPVDRTIGQRATELLIEAVRQQDEIARGGVGADDDDDLELSLTEFDDADAQAETPASSASEAVVSTNQEAKEHDEMASNIQGNLERLRGIDGYLGAALVDSESGMTLGTDGGGAALNLDLAAAGNTDVVRAKRKTIKSLGLKDEIEDILITLGRQYHIVRPLRARPGVFYYVVIDRQKANLAMARMAIADVEKALEL
ncbi:MAG: DUF4388 domain-containing protein [Kofleriaceae bacterium]